MKEKRLDFELLRIIAIVLVVFNHTEHRGFSLYLVEGGSLFNNGVSLLLAIVCKIAVPLFLLVSGGLLLHKEEPISVVLKKRVLRMGITAVLFSGILYFFWVRWGYAQEPGLFDFVRRVWSEGISEPYWYLYGYTALMLLLPLLRPLVRGLGDSGFVYLTILHILLGISVPVGYLLGLGTVNPDFYLPFIEQNLFYFIMGYYLCHRFHWERMTGKKLVGVLVAGAAAVGVMFGMTWLDIARNGESTQFFMNCLLCFPVFAVYALVHQLIEKHPVGEKTGKFISSLGGCVFGTYLLEGILRRELLPMYDFLEPKIHVLPACLLWVGAVVVLGLAITWLLKKLPLFRKLL